MKWVEKGKAKKVNWEVKDEEEETVEEWKKESYRRTRIKLEEKRKMKGKMNWEKEEIN